MPAQVLATPLRWAWLRARPAAIAGHYQYRAIEARAVDCSDLDATGAACARWTTTLASMDKDDFTRLQSQRLHLVAALATIDKALEALPPMTRHGERARLTGEMQASLAALGAVNTRMASLGRLGRRNVAAVP